MKLFGEGKMKIADHGKRATLLILITVSGWLSIEAQGNLTAKDIEAIKTVEKSYREAWLKNDERTILSLFAPDATLYPNGNPPIKGKDNIRKFWFASTDTITTIRTFQAEIEDITGDKNFAIATGSNAMNWKSEKIDKSATKSYVSKGYFISVYSLHSGEWKILKQFWNAKTEEIRKHSARRALTENDLLVPSSQ